MKVLFDFDLSPALQEEFTPRMAESLSGFVIAQAPEPPAHLVVVLWNPPGYSFFCAPAEELASIVASIALGPGEEGPANWLNERLREPAGTSRRVLCLFKAGRVQGTALILGDGGAA